MPIRHPPQAPAEIDLDPRREISPYELFRRLREGETLQLADVRPKPTRMTLAGARPWPLDGTPPTAESRTAEIILFDDDGRGAFDLAQELATQGWQRVRALFGGLDLYDYALDPAVVGEERFLRNLSSPQDERSAN